MTRYLILDMFVDWRYDELLEKDNIICDKSVMVSKKNLIASLSIKKNI